MKTVGRKTIILLVLLNSFALGALEFETALSLGLGKRFVDTFDRRWPNIRASSADFAPAVHDRLETMRDLTGTQLLFLVSPFYRHFFGLGIHWFATPGKVSQRYTVNNAQHSWDLTLSGYAPLVHYRYYPQGNEKQLYFSGTAGLVLGTMNLQHRSSIANTEAVLDRIRGPLFEAAVGYVFTSFGKAGLFAEFALQTQRLDELEGYYRENGTPKSFKLKYNKSYLIPVEPAEESNLQNFTNAIIWNTQLRIAIGLSYRL